MLFMQQARSTLNYPYKTTAHRTAWGFVATQKGVAGLTPWPFTSEEETGSHNGHGHVHRTRMLICMQAADAETARAVKKTGGAPALIYQP